jgi:hypothetical protein
MPHHEVEMLALEEGLARNRMVLSKSVSELATRVRPRHVVNVAMDRMAGKAVKLTSDIFDLAKANTGKATLFGIGALLAFDIGRRSSQPQDVPLPDATAGAPDDTKGRGKASWGTMLSELSNAARYWGGGGVALLLGFLIGKAVPVSKAEEELLGEIPGDAKRTAKTFWRQHAHGAKVAAADIFGVARIVATGLGLMFALATIVGRDTDDRAEPSISGTRRGGAK